MRGLALVVLGASVALAGCGAAEVEEDTPSLEQVARATKAQSYRYELTMEGKWLDEPFRVTATGAADPTRGLATLRYTFNETGEEQWATEIRHVGGKAYVRIERMGSGWTEASDDSAPVFPFGAFSEPHRAIDALVRHGRDVESELARTSTVFR